MQEKLEGGAFREALSENAYGLMAVNVLMFCDWF
jgi:hypothetical protein